ncbi:hypothetical protein D3C74_446380 [compost metagenome]
MELSSSPAGRISDALAGICDLMAIISEALSAESSGDFIFETGSLMKVQPDSRDMERATAARRLRTRVFNFITLSLFRGSNKLQIDTFPGSQTASFDIMFDSAVFQHP